MFDLRVGREPVIESTPDYNRHRSPIVDLIITGSRNSSNIVSVAENGTLCSWSPNLD